MSRIDDIAYSEYKKEQEKVKENFQQEYEKRNREIKIKKQLDYFNNIRGIFGNDDKLIFTPIVPKKKKTTKKETPIKKKTTKQKGDIIQYTLDGRELATTTLEELNNKYGYEKGIILSCCKGRIKSAYGYKWEQIDTNDKPNLLNILLENTFEKEKVSKKNKGRNKLMKLSK